MNRLSDKNKGVLYIVITALLWSTGGIAIKLVDAPSTFISMGRSAVAGLFFLPFIRFRDIRWSKDLFILIISYTVCLTTYIMANKLTTAANAIAIQYSSPLFMFLGIWVFKKKFEKTKLLPMLVILLGIVAFLLEPSTGSNGLGNFLAMISGIAFALVIYFLGHDYGISSAGITGLINLFLFPIVALFVPWRESPWPTDGLSYVMLVYLGIFQIGVAYILFYKGRRTVDALNANIIGLIEPMLNPLIVFFVIHEVPTAYALVGAGLILLGQILNSFEERRKQRKILN